MPCKREVGMEYAGVWTVFMDQVYAWMNAVRAGESRAVGAAGLTPCYLRKELKIARESKSSRNGLKPNASEEQRYMTI